MRIACCSNYSLAEARRLYLDGRYPRQGLYGAAGLTKAGHECLWYDDMQPAEWLPRRVRSRIGTWEPARRARADAADLIFAASEHPLAGYAALPSALRRRRLAVIYHSPPRTDVLSRRAARRYDFAFTLSEHARKALLNAGRDPNLTATLSWGPQLDYACYQTAPATVPLVTSIGKSGRDLDLLSTAAAQAGVPALAYAPPGWAPPEPGTTVRPTSSVQEYPVVLSDMARASIVAIPLTQLTWMAGLSELNDALAMGKPVVITKSPHVDVDVEAIGCGFTVGLGDVDGWTAALEKLRDPEVAAAAGSRGRAWAERHWNADVCDSQVAAHLARTFAAP